MATEGGLKRRISRTFLLQAAAIGVAALVSVYLAALVIKEVLVTEALRTEATYFWERHRQDPAFPLPDTRNLTGYLVRIGQESELPADLQPLTEGYHEVASAADFTTVYVTREGGERLYLLFDGERVNELAALFGLIPLAVVLIVLYLSVWMAYRASHRAVSPVTWLAREVNRLDPDTPDAAAFAAERLPVDADEEVRVLASALGGFARRLADFVERERNFTRDASHELRTPLTVIRVAADMLLDRDDLPPPARGHVERIRRSARGMQELVEAFLLLAREADAATAQQRVCINDLIAAELEQLRVLVGEKPVEIASAADCALWIEGPARAASALLANLLRNAITFTEQGRVKVSIEKNQVVIEDSGVGIEPDRIEEMFRPFVRGEPDSRGGHGVGLAIVRRFSERFRWPVHVVSEPGRGTRVTVAFPDAECLPVGSPDHASRSPA